jgi:hypothetical protein
MSQSLLIMVDYYHRPQGIPLCRKSNVPFHANHTFVGKKPVNPHQLLLCCINPKNARYASP